MNIWGNSSLEAEIRVLAQVVGQASGAHEVLLFGSVARGDAGPESDLDLLLVLEDGADRRAATVQARRALGRQRFALDLVAVTQRDFHDPHNAFIEAIRPELRGLYAQV
jgi:uncharacterized protein